MNTNSSFSGMTCGEIALELTKAMLTASSIVIPSCNYPSNQSLVDAVGDYYCQIFEKISSVLLPEQK